MKFEINWNYPIERNENRIFPQVCELDFERDGKVSMPKYNAGVYISNLINACNVEERLEGYKNSEAFAEWARITGDDYISRNNIERNENYILYDSMAFPAFCIYKNVQSTLSELEKHLSNREYRHWSRCSEEILGEEMLLRFNTGEINAGGIQAYEGFIQNCIDIYVEKYNDMLMSAQREKGISFYRQLCDCLRTYDNGKRRMIKEYLKGDRCFATFIKRSDGQKFISFSGTVDAKDETILEWLGKSQPEGFVAVAESICYSMSAIFVPINLNTRRYNVKSPLPFYIEQGLSVEDIIKLKYNSKDYKEYYSCCERKIFGHFNDRTPDGTLYVKMKACCECGLGLIYQWSVGGKVILQDGLRC